MARGEGDCFCYCCRFGGGGTFKSPTYELTNSSKTFATPKKCEKEFRHLKK
jgi:hypothetical protein